MKRYEVVFTRTNGTPTPPLVLPDEGVIAVLMAHVEDDLAHFHGLTIRQLTRSDKRPIMEPADVSALIDGR